MAVFDTGFTGFVLTPLKVFQALELDELKNNPGEG